MSSGTVDPDLVGVQIIGYLVDCHPEAVERPPASPLGPLPLESSIHGSFRSPDGVHHGDIMVRGEMCYRDRPRADQPDAEPAALVDAWLPAVSLHQPDIDSFNGPDEPAKRHRDAMFNNPAESHCCICAATSSHVYQDRANWPRARYGDHDSPPFDHAWVWSLIAHRDRRRTSSPAHTRPSRTPMPLGFYGLFRPNGSPV
jgi:hypothetical protein